MKFPHCLCGCAPVCAVAAAAVALSGCGSLGTGPSGLAPAIDALANAGCSGDLSFSVTATTAAGLSPGAAALQNTFHGSCDPSRVRANVPVVVPAPVVAAPAAQK